MAVFIEFGAYLYVRQLVNLFEWLVVWRGKKKKIRERMRSATSYEEWCKYASEMDTYLGFEKWKDVEDDGFYDFTLVGGSSLVLPIQLRDVPDERRGAHFTCAIAFCVQGREPVVVEGRMMGHVIRETRGTGGFGYDVLFEAVEFPGRTTAELDPTDKDSVSHRGRALREIAPRIAAALR